MIRGGVCLRLPLPLTFAPAAEREAGALTVRHPDPQPLSPFPFEVLAENLKMHRAARNMTQPELARLAGTSHRAISRLESKTETDRHDPNAVTLHKIAQVFGVTIDALLTETK